MKRCLALMLMWAAVAGIAAAVSPPPPPDPMQYGRAYLAEGDNAAAVKSFAEAQRLNPADAAALNNLAVAKAAAGDYQAALDLLTRARKLAPNRADIKENLDKLQAWTRNYGAANAGQPANVAAPAPEPPALWVEAPQQNTNTRNPVCGTEPCK
jgi:tetratricopeptide (TPR) repeat protein